MSTNEPSTGDATAPPGTTGHGHGRTAGGLRWLRSAFRPHSHDAADSVDSALEANAHGIRAVKISLFVLLATATGQAFVVWLTGSVALLADTIHNFSDALTAVPLWIAFALGRRAPSRRYTYGFGRAEDLAGVFIVAMIALSAVVAGYESILRLLYPQPVTNVGVLIAAGLVGFAGNELVAVYRIRVGRRIGSAALVADGLHARTDGFTSLAVVLGALGVLAGFPLADPVIGILITIAILVVLKGAAVDIYRRLMDAVDPSTVDHAESCIRAVPGVVDVEELRLRWTGHRLRAETGIVVDPDLSVVDAHAIAHAAQHALLHGIPKLVTATVHTSPQSADGHAHHATLAHHPEAVDHRATAAAGTGTGTDGGALAETAVLASGHSRTRKRRDASNSLSVGGDTRVRRSAGVVQGGGADLVEQPADAGFDLLADRTVHRRSRPA